MEISLAKPLNDKRKQAQSKREQRGQFDEPFNPRSAPVGNTSGGNRGRPPSSGFGNNSNRGGGSMNRSNDSFSQLYFVR
jgi:hypothetical protein